MDSAADDIVEWLAGIDQNDSYAQYVPTPEKFKEVALELDTLPDELKWFFLHIVRITMVENFSHTGILIPLESPGFFAMALNPKVLEEDISEFLTRKENSHFQGDSSFDLRVKVDKDISGLTAIVLHELGHVINFLAQVQRNEKTDDRQLTRPLQDTSAELLWDSFDEMSENPLKAYEMEFYGENPPRRELSEIRNIYRDLSDSPYPTLYGTTDQGEDFAELGMLYALHAHFQADVRIELESGGKTIESFSLISRAKMQDRFALYQKAVAEGFKGDRPADDEKSTQQGEPGSQ
jgi:hypothetical protein